MGLFCEECDEKATYGDPSDGYPKYCNNHKSDDMVLIPRIIRNVRQLPNCLICDLDFTTLHICVNCLKCSNPEERLVLKYVRQNLDANLINGHHPIIIVANFKGDITNKLLELEQLFKAKKVLLFNCNIQLDDIYMIKRSLTYGLLKLNEHIERKITRSEYVSVN
jgi:hypothetical protein